MQRLVVALFIIAVVVALGYALISILRRAAVASDDIAKADTPMQRISFFLLAALMVYVAVVGAS